ncbi:polyhydroxyalkanoate synthesis regulator DNA-binding domain-containing protein [Desulfosarcina sp.]|uniref:polyhydroxyalkanoate synthesis regulator DNA-binding domain-containing protein n=1 Tax=Desulfosarcina sp. TaxID=2027861 RepID=UPI003970F2F4
MPDPIVLKKYSNRRLYDTRNSRYVTLEDVSAMIRAGEQVRIQDATSGEDVTAFILTQVILEAAKRRNNLLPVPVLHLIIQFGDNLLGDFFEKYLEKTIQNYIATRKAFDHQFDKWLDLGVDMSRRMPEVMSGVSSVEAMLEIFGVPRPPTTGNNTPSTHLEPPGKGESDPPTNR